MDVDERELAGDFGQHRAGRQVGRADEDAGQGGSQKEADPESNVDRAKLRRVERRGPVPPRCRKGGALPPRGPVGRRPPGCS